MNILNIPQNEINYKHAHDLYQHTLKYSNFPNFAAWYNIMISYFPLFHGNDIG